MTKNLSKSSAAVLLFMTECALPREVTFGRAEMRALDSACRKLDALFKDEEVQPIEVQPNGAVSGRFHYNGSPCELEFEKNEHAVLEKFMNVADRKPFTTSLARAKAMLLETEWGGEPEKVQEG